MKYEQQFPPYSENLIAQKHFSGFVNASDTYNAISIASDGNVYYILSSNTLEGGRMYRYMPKTGKSELLADLTAICGEKLSNAIPQGMSHSRLYEWKGKLYFATHVAFYEMIGSFERLPVNPPSGYKLYPGGHILSYDLLTGQFEDLAIAPGGDGIVTMTMDTTRGQIYAISWPKGRFLHYDVEKACLKDVGNVSAGGEAGNPGEDYRVLCRSMIIDPRDGCVFLSTSEGEIVKYDHQSGILNPLNEINLKFDYFGKYDYTSTRTMGYNWRKILWYEPENMAYGVHGNTGYLFRLDTKLNRVELVRRITSEPSQRSGMNDQFTYGYLGFVLGPDKHTIYYLTGGPIYKEGKLVKGDNRIAVGSKGEENLHLITYHIPEGKYTDHGPIFYNDGTRPSYVNAIAVDYDGTIYTIARFEHDGRVVPDLISICGPF